MRARPARSRTTVRRLIEDLLRPHMARVGAAIACMLVVAACTGITAWLLDPAMRYIFQEQNARMLVLIPLAILGVSAVKAGAAYGQGVLIADVARRLVTELQTGLFARYMSADIARLKEGHSGTYQTHFLQNANLVAASLSSSLVGLFRDVPTMIVLIGVMFYMDWVLASCALIVAPLIALASARLSRIAKKSITGTIEASNKLSKSIAETLQGVRIVRAYGQEETEAKRARHLIEERMRLLFKAQRASLAAAPLTEAVAGAGIGIAIYYGGWRVISGTLEQSEFFAFIIAMVMAFQPMRTISNLATLWAQGTSAADEIFREMDAQPSIKDRPGASRLLLKENKGAHICLDDVSFDYDDMTPALNDVTIEARPGETVALVGASGAGKSTVFNLLLRFYEPKKGRVLIDDQDIRGVTISSLREQIALVTQEAILFDDSIAANIAYGVPTATREEIAAAARHAAADEFIAGLARGYDTRVGEDGGLLSGGQRQRIAIARAFLKDAPILLLDEATSALDSASEKKVQEALGSLMRGRTTIVIAHRLSTIHSADRIYVLDQGRVVEYGTHDSLMVANGTYARLYRTQFREVDALKLPLSNFMKALQGQHQ